MTNRLAKICPLLPFALIFALGTLPAFAQSAEYERIAAKANALIEKEEITVTAEEAAFFSGAQMRSKIVARTRRFAEEHPGDKDELNALADYVALENYRLQNAIPLGQGVFFLNYAVRVDWSGNKVPKSADALLQPKYNYYLILTYSTAEKSILEFTPSINAYTPLNFHKTTLEKKTVLYAIENGSSFGWATEKILLSVFDPATFSGLAQEIILYSQSFYSTGVEDIEFCKDFEFSENALHVWGTDFDFDAGKYIRGYDKVYRF